MLEKINELSQKYQLRVANVFHAGDGNLHPLILYDANVAGELEKSGGTDCACAEHNSVTDVTSVRASFIDVTYCACVRDHFRYSRRVDNSCSTSGTSRLILVT
jgi:hypothetical protein